MKITSVIPSKTAFTFANFSRFPFPYTSLLAGDTCAVHTLNELALQYKIHDKQRKYGKHCARHLDILVD